MAVKYKATKDFNIRVEKGTVFNSTLRKVVEELLAAGAIEKAEEPEKDKEGRA